MEDEKRQISLGERFGVHAGVAKTLNTLKSGVGITPEAWSRLVDHAKICEVCTRDLASVVGRGAAA